MASGEFKPRQRRRIASVLAEGRSKQTFRQSPIGDMMSPQEVDAAWRRLLEETLPEEKRELLMSSYENESDPHRRYSMLLEFSSYLRQVSGTE
jgi:hypothetical protein